MQQYSFGAIVLLAFPFSNSMGAKRRPALVLLDTGDQDIVVARVTSQAVRSPFDVNIVAWQQAGLLLASIVRVDKLATLEKRLIERQMGSLNDDDRNRVRAALQQLWNSM
jgi:mRNA interferase MazF